MEEKRISGIPDHAIAFIDLVVKKILYRKKVRQEIREELVAHFEDELRGCTNEQDRDRKAQQLIADFGDPKVLATLMRRAKKRCRPLWAKAVVHGLQAIGIVLLYLVICALPLTIGRPTIRINYVDWINDLGRAGKDESLNAKPYLDKAVELAAKAPAWLPELKAYRATWPGEMNDQERKAAAEFLDKRAQALDALREAVRKPHYWVHYQLDPDAMNGSLQTADPLSPKGSFSAGICVHVTKYLASYRDLGLTLALQSEWKAYTNDVDGALQDCLLLVKFGMHLEGKGSLTEQLVGTALEHLAHDQLFDILEKTNPSPHILKKVQQELEGLYSAQKAVISLDTEKAFLYEYVQRTFTDDGKGNGRVLKQGVPLVVSDWKSGLKGLLLFNYPDRREVTRRINEFYKAFERQFEIMPSSGESEANRHRLNEIARGNLFLPILAPALERMEQLIWLMKTGRAAVMTVLGGMRYQKETGQYPKDLNEVVAAGYLDALPIDPFSGGPLVYRRTDGGFLLYSFGTNLKDDGGKQGVDSEGQPRMWRDNGDWVFWPVAD